MVAEELNKKRKIRLGKGEKYDSRRERRGVGEGEIKKPEKQDRIQKGYEIRIQKHEI